MPILKSLLMILIKKYNFNITLPSFSSHPKFLAYNSTIDDDIEYGALYWLHSFDPE